MSEERVTLGDVVTPRREKGAPSEHPELPFIGLEHIEAHTMRLLGTVPAGTMRSNANRFYAGDVLYGRLRPYLNKVFVPAFDGYCSAEFIVLPKSEWIDSSFLKFRLNARDFVSFASHLNAGDRPRVDFDQLSSFAFFLPSSLPAQRAIVAKIEELFSELDKGIENLKTAREQLKIYRQALLKHAFEGKLTAQWRAANPDKLETAAALLARIQTEREQRYRQQLQQWETTGGSKPKAPKPLPPLTQAELAELPALPEGWGWELIGRFTEVKGGKRLPAGANYCEHSTPHPYIRVVDFENFGVHASGLKYISSEIQKQISQYTISSVDTYISIAGTIGRVGTISQLLEGANLTENAAKICGNAVVNNKFLSYWLHSVGGSSQLVEKTISTTQPKLALFRIEKVAVPVCSMEEQMLIVNYLEYKLSEVDQLELTLAASLQQSEALRQSILKKAFAGTLVAQDANDEPAAALLARILAEKQIGNQGAKKSVSRSKRNE